MKKICLSLLSLLIFSAMSAQSGNAVIFTELGEKFTVYLNGEQQNDAPTNNVKLDDLTAEFYQVRIDFEDDALPDVMNNNFGVQFGNTVTYMVKMNKKGRYVIRLHNITENGTTAEARPVRPAQEVQPATETRPASTEVQSTTTIESVPTSTNVVITESTTTTRPSGGENVNVSMNVGGTGVSINMNVDDMEHSETTTVTTTTTTMERPGTSSPAPRPVEEAKPTGPAGCSHPMDKSEFESNMNSIKGKSFEDAKMTLAKQITRSKCLTAEQVATIMRNFSFEDTRLEFAKFAYDYCFDQENYFKVNDAFQFEMTIEELDEFLQSR